MIASILLLTFQLIGLGLEANGQNVPVAQLPSDAYLGYQGTLAPFIQLRDVPRGSPTAILANGSYYGIYDSHFKVDKFFGVRFAQPVTGKNRLRAPQSLNETWSGFRNATAFGPSCPQPSPGLYWIMEDCLNLQIYRPAGVNKYAKLPVVIYFHGGGGLSGSSADPTYNFTNMVSYSARVGEPFIGVVPNYRMRHLGTMASDELLWEEATNLFIRDNHMEVRWVSENIEGFGGDKTKVTLMGQSFGGILTGYQMLLNDGENGGLFRSAIMASGSPSANAFGSFATGQTGFNSIANLTGCDEASDVLSCLRNIDYITIAKAIHASNVTVSPGAASVDGLTVKRLPHSSISQGLYSKVPTVLGTCRDEGTAFVGNIANDFATLYQQFVERDIFPQPALTGSSLDRIFKLYPDDSAEGAPFNGLNYTLPAYPFGLQYRRAAAIAGDVGLEQAKRFFATHASSKMPIFGYQWDTVPYAYVQTNTSLIRGVSHSSDTPFLFYNTDSTLASPIGNFTTYVNLAKQFSTAIICFISKVDPNNCQNSGVPTWPKFGTAEGGQLLRWKAEKESLKIDVIQDTYRNEAINYLKTILLELRV